MRLIQRSLVSTAIALALAASGNAAAQFSNVYFFGDSLTDMGSYKPVLPPGRGMFTTNPGPVWAQPFAQNFGFSASPANQGGNDYAYGGARVTLSPGYPASAPTGAAVPVERGCWMCPMKAFCKPAMRARCCAWTSGVRT